LGIFRLFPIFHFSVFFEIWNVAVFTAFWKVDGCVGTLKFDVFSYVWNVDPFFEIDNLIVLQRRGTLTVRLYCVLI